MHNTMLYILDRVLGVQPGDSVLVLYDEKRAEYAAAISGVARGMTEQVSSIEVPERLYPGEGLPSAVETAVQAADVALGCCSRSTWAPLWDAIRRDQTSRVRAVSFGNCSRAVFDSAGHRVAPALLNEILDQLYGALVNAHRWCLRSAGGTLLTSEVAECKVIERLPVSTCRAVASLPAGEIALDPVLGSVEGVFVSDGSCGLLDAEDIGYPGRFRTPIKCIVRAGEIVDVSGGKEAALFQTHLSRAESSGLRTMSHLAIGANPLCLGLTGAYLVDEKIFGGLHVAHAGGTGCVSGNIDHCLLPASLDVDDAPVIEDGRFVGSLSFLEQYRGADGYGSVTF